MLPEVNLLPKYERTESRIYSLFIVGLILIVTTTGVLAYFYFTTSSALEDVVARVAALDKEKTILETRLSSLDTKSDTLSFSGIVTYVEGYQLPTSELVDEFITLLPDHAYLSRYDFNYNSVTIETQFETLPATSDYVADLTKSAYLEDVIIEQLSTFTPHSAGDEVEDEITVDDRYKIIPQYDVRYSMQVNHENLAREEENDETAISGE